MGAVTLADGVVFGDENLGLIAGPCVIESRDHCLRMAEAVADASRRMQMPCVFKASYYKANRTSVSSYRGPGLEEGLRILAEVRDAVGLPVLTDVHEPGQAVVVAECIDVLQVPAFLCRQTDLVLAVAETGRPVNLKKGQFLAPWDMRKVVEKAASTGNEALLVTERGTSFGYNNLVVDFKGLSFLAGLGYPVALDVTHSLQLPARQGESSGGEPEFVEPLAAAGVASGVDILFLEVHDNPAAALSDASTQLPLERLEPLLEKLLRIRSAAHDTSTTARQDAS